MQRPNTRPDIRSTVFQGRSSAALAVSLIQLLICAIFFGAFSPAAQAAEDATKALRYLPIQDGGRIKPLDTFARETLQLVYGSQTYKSANGEKKPAIEIVMTWMLIPQYWDGQKIVEVSHKGLKDSLKLPTTEKHFSPTELFANSRIGLVMQELGAFRETKQKLNPYFQAVQRLESQLGIYQSIKQGTAIRLVPPRATEVAAENATAAGAAPMGEAAKGGALRTPPQSWLSVAELKGDFQMKFADVTRAFIRTLPQEGQAPPKEASATADITLAQAVDNFKTAARAENPALYPSEKMINIEVHYKELQPFLISWILYVAAAVFIAFAWQTDKSFLYRLGWSTAIVAFLLHTYGFGLRMYITGRPPVSNMYETVIWVSWGAIIFSFFFESMNRRKFVLLSGSIVAALCLIVADFAPTILDRSLQPLEPVLRSNMWLTVHVLTITLSYSGFFLAWGLGNIGLSFILRGDKPTSERMRALTQAIYRSIQVGVVLLAAGIILGGIWADYSWGRFWGWDPKETWALIALLGYLAILHGRLAGWVQNFGMMANAIVAFNLVIMAWYGVNFVLGAGLHSYGFGAGGVQYVGAFVVLNLVYVGYVAYIRFNQLEPVRVTNR